MILTPIRSIVFLLIIMTPPSCPLGFENLSTKPKIQPELARYTQASSRNKNPIIARFDGEKQIWCRTDLETSNDDNTGYGLIWDGKESFYAAFSTTGTQGPESGDLRRFPKEGWFKSYGAGGGAKIAIIAKISASTGVPIKATYLRAQIPNGNANTLIVKGFSWDGQHLTVEAKSWYSPIKADKSVYNCSGGRSPFDYTVKLDGDLTKAIETTASEPCH